MAEYGISSPEELAEGWTPAQIVLMTGALRRRQSRQAAEQLELMYLAAAAAQGGKEGQKAIASATRKLRQSKGTQPVGLAQQLRQAFNIPAESVPEPTSKQKANMP